jgi:hypothetical protein
MPNSAPTRVLYDDYDRRGLKDSFNRDGSLQSASSIMVNKSRPFLSSAIASVLLSLAEFTLRLLTEVAPESASELRF